MHRKNDLKEAIMRYLSANKEINLGWIKEYNHYIKKESKQK